MRDLTAILMGDPGTSPRRPPTPEEISEVKARTSYEQQKSYGSKFVLLEWPVGTERIFSTWRKARNAQSKFYLSGRVGTLRANDDGTYTVRRIF